MASVLDQLQARVQQALRHFPELQRAIPAAELRSPEHLHAWISAAAGMDPKGAQRASFGELREAVEKWGAASDLVDRATRLYHDPRTIAEFGDQRDYYLAHPEEAYQALIANAGTGGTGLAGERNRQLRQDLLLAVREAIDLSAEHGISTSEGPAPLPADPGRQRAEYQALLKESVENRRKFDPEKQQRLEALAGVIAGATEAEAAPRRKSQETPVPTKPSGEYGALLKEYVNDRRNFSPEKLARLEHLATDRAAASGLFETSEGTQENDEL